MKEYKSMLEKKLQWRFVEFFFPIFGRSSFLQNRNLVRDVLLKGKKYLQHKVSCFDFSILGSGCKDVCAWAISPESDRTGRILKYSIVLDGTSTWYFYMDLVETKTWIAGLVFSTVLFYSKCFGDATCMPALLALTNNLGPGITIILPIEICRQYRGMLQWHPSSRIREGMIALNWIFHCNR